MALRAATKPVPGFSNTLRSSTVTTSTARGSSASLGHPERTRVAPPLAASSTPEASVVSSSARPVNTAQPGHFTDKTVWVTGASSGIGAAIIKEIAQDGGRVILSSRRVEQMEEIVCELPGECQTAILTGDFRDLKALEDLADRAWEEFDGIDIVIHNAGIGGYGNVKDMEMSVHHEVMDVDYWSYVLITRALLPRMIERQSGHFVVMSSCAGRLGAPNMAAYSAAKHALHGFFESLRMEIAVDNIDITMVCPGWIKTNITKDMRDSDGTIRGKDLAVMENAMDLEDAAPQIVDAIRRKKMEAYVVKHAFRPEMLALRLMQLSPNLYARLTVFFQRLFKIRNIPGSGTEDS